MKYEFQFIVKLSSPIIIYKDITVLQLPSTRRDQTQSKNKAVNAGEARDMTKRGSISLSRKKCNDLLSNSNETSVRGVSSQFNQSK